jgi:nicotinate phosphoribosyltransferase
VIRRADISHIELLHDTVFGNDIDTPLAQSIDELAERCRVDVDRLDIGVRRLVNPHRYHVSLTSKLYELRKTLVADAQV